jgi:hypothetical protein
MKKLFAECVDPFEHETVLAELLGLHKELIRKQPENPKIYISTSGCNSIYMDYIRAQTIKKETKQDNISILPYLYKLDGYTTDVVIYDELEKEN